jgi:hypothetical protein
MLLKQILTDCFASSESNNNMAFFFDYIDIPISQTKYRRKIFIHYTKLSKCALMMANGDSILLYEFSVNATPDELKKCFIWDSFKSQSVTIYKTVRSNRMIKIESASHIKTVALSSLSVRHY